MGSFVTDDLIAKQVLRIAREVMGGLFEPPPKMVDSITAWVIGVLAYRIRLRLRNKLDDYEEHKDWTGFDPKDFLTAPSFMTIGDMEKIEKTGIERFKQRLRSDIKRMESYILASPIPPKHVSKKWQRAFKIDLSGWKYLSRVQAADPANLKYAASVYPSVKVEINMSENDTESAAWYVVQRRLVVYADIDFHGSRLVDDAGDVIRDLQRTIAHELRHFAQDYLSLVVGSQDKAGLPPKRYRTPDIEQSLGKERKREAPERIRKTIENLEAQGITKDIFHDLDDVEFYAELAGAIETISDNMPHFAPEDRKAAFLSFVGAGEKVSGTYPLKFMISLKKHAPGKWQKAVKELAKGVFP